MSIPNYQLIKEAEWYYLAKKRFMLTNFINAVALSSALVELKQSEHGIPPVPPLFTPTPRGERPASTGSKLTAGDSTDETKPGRNISPLVLNSKDKVFDIGSEIIGRSSPVTVKPPKVEGQNDGSAEKKKEDRKSVDRKSGVFVEGINLEGMSLLNRRKSKELVLKVKRASTDSLESLGRRRSSEKVETLSGAEKDEVGSRSDVVETPSTGGTEQKSPLVVDSNKKVTGAVDSRKSSLEKSDVFDSPSTGGTEQKSPLVADSDKKATTAAEARKSSFEKSGESCSGGEARRSSDTSESKHSLDSPSIVLQQESNLASPLVTDVSIQLTKTDGRSECYRAPSEGKLAHLEVDNSFENEDPENEGILKRCSSFAGFRSDTPCGTIKPEDESLSQAHSPVKGFHPVMGPVGRLRHFSAPLSGQGTPKSRVSTLPQTPSWMSSRGSFTEDGN